MVARNQLLLATRETETGEADAEQREGGRLGNSQRIAVANEIYANTAAVSVKQCLVDRDLMKRADATDR